MRGWDEERDNSWVGFNTIYKTVGAGPWGRKRTRPGKEKVARSVNSAPPLLIVKYSTQQPVRSTRPARLCSRYSLYQFAGFYCLPPHTSCSSRRHSTCFLAGGAVVSTRFRSTVSRTRVICGFGLPRSVLFHKFSSHPSEHSNEPGVFQRGASSARCIQKDQLSVFRLGERRKVRTDYQSGFTHTLTMYTFSPSTTMSIIFPGIALPSSSKRIPPPRFTLTYVVHPAHDTIAIISSVLYHAILFRSRLPFFGSPDAPIDLPTLLFLRLA